MKDYIGQELSVGDWIVSSSSDTAHPFDVGYVLNFDEYESDFMNLTVKYPIEDVTYRYFDYQVLKISSEAAKKYMIKNELKK